MPAAEQRDGAPPYPARRSQNIGDHSGCFGSGQFGFGAILADLTAFPSESFTVRGS